MAARSAIRDCHRFAVIGAHAMMAAINVGNWEQLTFFGRRCAFRIAMGEKRQTVPDFPPSRDETFSSVHKRLNFPAALSSRGELNALSCLDGCAGRPAGD
jgi:hypothetical protein